MPFILTNDLARQLGGVRCARLGCERAHMCKFRGVSMHTQIL